LLNGDENLLKDFQAFLTQQENDNLNKALKSIKDQLDKSNAKMADMSITRRKQMKVMAMVVVVVMLLGGVCFAQDKTVQVAGIKPVTVQTQGSVQAYQVPIVQTLPKSDGSGNIEVVVQTITVTKDQLQQQITNMNNQIAQAQKVVTQAQAQLDAITAQEQKVTQ
jgi:hypothetical protein